MYRVDCQHYSNLYLLLEIELAQWQSYDSDSRGAVREQWGGGITRVEIDCVNDMFQEKLTIML